MRPVETVNWYAAIVFCNKLSLKLGLTPYYSIENKNIDWETIQYDEIPDEKTAKEERAEWDKVICDKNSNGFRRKLSGNLRRAAEMQKLMHGSMHLQERSVHRLIRRAFGIE